MSRTSAFLLLLVLLAVAGIAWVFLAGADRLRDEIAPDEVERVAVEDPAEALRDEPGLAGFPEAQGSGRRRRTRWPVLPSDRIPRGVLDVLPVYPDETPVDVREVTVRLEREGSSFYAPPLGVPNYDTGVWRFDHVVIGWVRVVVVGDHVAETVARAQVAKGRTETIRVEVERAGAIAFEATLYSGERPERMTLELRDPETKQPRAVWWAVRSAEAHASPRRAARVDIGPEGILYPVPPGRWILYAESPAGEVDPVDVEVVAGETAKAAIQLRR